MKASGFSLVELLVAATITTVALAASFGWLWNVAALAARADDRAQGATIAAACARAVGRDVGGAVAVVAPPAARDAARSLALVHDRPGVAAEEVLVVWDPSRRVLWRNASGTYLGDHVVAFRVAYLLAGGGLVEGGDMRSDQWAAVRGVRAEVAVTVGSATCRRTVVVPVRPS